MITTDFSWGKGGRCIRVRTHQQSRVESNPVQSDSPRRGSDSMPYFQWPPRQCVHTSRVESSRVTRVLPSQESWCRMFYFRQSDPSDRAWLPLSWGRNGRGKAYSPSEGPRGNFRRFALWAQIRDYVASVWQKIAQEMGVGKTSASMFYFLLDDDDIHNKSRSEYGRGL